MVYGLDGNTALVAASSSGLGKASAKALARDGANVVINGRDEDRLEEAAAEVRALAEGDVLPVQGDLTDPNDIARLVERTIDEFDRLDHLVTNAGGPPSGAFLETEEEDWYQAFDLLVMSAGRLVRESASHLRRDGGGTIVTITSRSVKEAIPSLVLSNSVRMSVIGLEKTLSKELAPEVRANAVLPAPHETARQRELIEAAVDRDEFDSYEEGLDAKGEINPLGRIGDPMELGDVVAFLSSERSSFINGVAIPVDGGQGASNL
ncbi:SDR family oxidoreductase [Salinigranum salinum]|uniref:SDR family oxidoreductase n=1 Tax=Salinigranum salinum TaxID=1364937 RepID=UPI001260E348|nr:SDR family oxidoreductase [Salinigranum salinum]